MDRFISVKGKVLGCGGELGVVKVMDLFLRMKKKMGHVLSFDIKRQTYTYSPYPSRDSLY